MNDKLTISESVLESKLVQLHGILRSIHHWTMTAAQGHHSDDAAALEPVIDHLCVRGVDIVRSLSRHAGSVELAPLTPSHDYGECVDDEEDDEPSAAIAEEVER